MKKVINDLNSILIEGAVSGKPCMVGEGKAVRCSFVVSNLRYFRDGENIKEQKTRVWVMLRGIELVKVAAVKVRDGRVVRVVGRLSTDEDNIPYIEAEHIEYQPKPKPKPGDEE